MDTHKFLRTTRSSPNVLTGTTGPRLVLKLESKSQLQINITNAKLKLSNARVALLRYSTADNSISKTLAQQEFMQAGKEVEDACRAWVHAARTKT